MSREVAAMCDVSINQKSYSQCNTFLPDDIARSLLAVPGQEKLYHLLPFKLALQFPEISVSKHPEHHEHE